MTTKTIDITDDQIEALRIEAGHAGDSLQIACCVIALADDRDRWARAVSEAKWAQADALWPSPAAARAECARVIADAQAEEALVRYRVREEGGAETTITAHSIEEAIEEARAWVEGGSYDAPGAVTAWVTEIGPDGAGIHGTMRTITVRVGLRVR